MCSISTDGAAVMFGSKSGAVSRIKENVPVMLATHYIAHRFALSCAVGADNIQYLVKFQEISNSIIKVFMLQKHATLPATQFVINLQ